MGRPKGSYGKKTLEVTEDLVTALCTVLPNPIESIAEYLGMTERTLRDRFPEAIKRGRAIGKKQLSQWQWKNANKGNVGMQVFLGKNYLEQTEKVDIKSKGKTNHTIKLKYSLDEEKEEEKK